MKIFSFSKTYEGRCVLDFPGMELQPETIYAIIGANGSGKSTFAKILAGVLKADQKGSFLDMASVGYMPQKNYAFRMSTKSNILLNGKDEARANGCHGYGNHPAFGEADRRVCPGNGLRLDPGDPQFAAGKKNC